MSHDGQVTGYEIQARRGIVSIFVILILGCMDSEKEGGRENSGNKHVIRQPCN